MRNALPLLLLALPGSAFAQLSVPWSTIDGGGGTSAGGDFTMFGVIGQPDAGATMSGGGFQITGGFIPGVTAPTGCNPADVGSQGGLPAPDNHLDNNDFIVFINYFFTHDSRADVGIQGGLAGHDGEFDNNDFIAFISLFFAGC